MFDISTVNKRYFVIKINDLMLEVEPPKLKALKKIFELSQAKNEEAINNLSEALKMILNKNKANIKVTDDIIEELDLDEMKEIITVYFEWLNKEKNSKN
ncbi:hypothetical protein SAMN05443428_1388 [Caloramator quimbayensis]|uniref:Phage tail assembly chaperone protein, E, or 41 or 14 n=1 Tax=Caloramator quimbayensis TaxID=1147123 RepID=A0A1T4YDB0_9CLOT|nr:hypothetical protein [Caloramator quimbayensis]SKA99769.1 hypothetical protein SAMN05443428_1388 [Caloramator quimbayensis]